MTLLDAIDEGLKGSNVGIPMDDRISHISRYLRGIQKKQIITLLAPPKAGKTTAADFMYVLSLCKYYMLNGLVQKRLNSIQYYSFEIDRITKEAEFTAHFIEQERGEKKNTVLLPNGITYQGERKVIISSDYILSSLISDQDSVIKLDVNVKKYIENKIYPKYIKVIFGEYNSKGTKISDGIINFIENRINPTGMYKDLLKIVEKEGVITKIPYKDSEGKTKYTFGGYKPHNSDKIIFVVVDHIRKINLERGWNLKQTIDKTLDYQVLLRNNFSISFLDIIHTNRNLVDEVTRKNPEYLHPIPDHAKDSSNFEEDSDIFLSLFNPNDDKYRIKKFFGKKIKDDNGGTLYPNLRSLHLVAARKLQFPVHWFLTMNGATKTFNKLKVD
jgi:hypothetical protein